VSLVSARMKTIQPCHGTTDVALYGPDHPRPALEGDD
jgi:hypothetical protein